MCKILCPDFNGQKKADDQYNKLPTEAFVNILIGNSAFSPVIHISESNSIDIMVLGTWHINNKYTPRIDITSNSKIRLQYSS